MKCAAFAIYFETGASLPLALSSANGPVSALRVQGRCCTETDAALMRTCMRAGDWAGRACTPLMLALPLCAA
eukprot:3471655-Pleurochrysis_carterae.AAC.1